MTRIFIKYSVAAKLRKNLLCDPPWFALFIPEDPDDLPFVVDRGQGKVNRLGETNHFGLRVAREPIVFFPRPMTCARSIPVQ